MPFLVQKNKATNKYQIKKINTGETINKNFLTRGSAISSAVNYMRYRHPKEKIIVQGNKILSKGKKK
jgi:hypothetical protein